MTPGDTYLDDEGAYRDRHLRVVAAVSSDGCLLTFGVTTHRPPCDESCVLEVGDHDFITRKSVVEYRIATLEPPEQARAMITRGIWIAQPRLSDAVLRRIQDGALASPRTKAAFQSIVRQQLGCELQVLRRRLRPRRR